MKPILYQRGSAIDKKKKQVKYIPSEVLTGSIEKNKGSKRNREWNFKYGGQEMLHWYGYLYFKKDRNPAMCIYGRKIVL